MGEFTNYNATKIYEALVKAGSEGATNKDLAKISLRYSSSIQVLKRRGHKIASIEITKSLWKYVYISAPTKKPKDLAAKEVVFNSIKQIGSVNEEQLEQLLEDKGIEFRWKYNRKPY